VWLFRSINPEGTRTRFATLNCEITSGAFCRARDGPVTGTKVLCWVLRWEALRWSFPVLK
jgi:hypothetical protein